MKNNCVFKNLKTGDILNINDCSVKMERHGGSISLSVNNSELKKAKSWVLPDMKDGEAVLKKDFLFDAQLCVALYDIVLYDFMYCIATIKDNDISVVFEKSITYYDNFVLTKEIEE